jgi:hypothetical protein
MEHICTHCGGPYDRPPSLAGSFCSRSCAGAARRKERPEHRRIRYAPRHPLAGATGLVSEARAALYDRIGGGAHKCHWCDAGVAWMVGMRGNAHFALIADHVDNDERNDAPSNLVPSCGRCNGSRTQRIEAGELFVTRPNGTRTRAVERHCIGCGARFLQAAAEAKNLTKGRFCSMSCARSKKRVHTL